MAHQIVSRVYVNVHTLDSPTDQEWDEHLRALIDARSLYDVLLVYTIGGTATGPQREKLMRLWSKVRDKRVAVVSDSRFVQTILRAFNAQIGADHQNFPLDQLYAAYRALWFTEGQRRAVDAQLRALAAELQLPEPAAEPRVPRSLAAWGRRSFGS
jgi:hypothetical protein